MLAHRRTALSSLPSLCSFSIGGAFSPASVVTKLEANPRFGRSLFIRFLSRQLLGSIFVRSSRPLVRSRTYTDSCGFGGQLRRESHGHLKSKNKHDTSSDASNVSQNALGIGSGSLLRVVVPVSSPGGRSQPQVAAAGPGSRSQSHVPVAGLKGKSR